MPEAERDACTARLPLLTWCYVSIDVLESPGVFVFEASECVWDRSLIGDEFSRGERFPVDAPDEVISCLNIVRARECIMSSSTVLCSHYRAPGKSHAIFTVAVYRVRGSIAVTATVFLTNKLQLHHGSRTHV